MEQISRSQFMKKLGDICDFQGGSQPPKSAWIKEAKDGYIRMLQIRDFTLSRQAQAEYVKIDKKLKICEKNDILLGRYGASVGKVLTGLSGAYNVAIMKTIPQKNTVLPKYLKLYFMSDAFQIALQKVCVTRSAQAGFSKEDIYDFPIYVPSLTEQERIVKKLDDAIYKIDCMKANAEFTLSATKDLFEGYVNSLFTEHTEQWQEKKLSDIGNIQTGTTPKTTEKDNFGDYIPFIKPSDFNPDGTLNYKNNGLTEKGMKQSRFIPKHSILMVCIGATITKTGYNDIDITCNQQINTLTPKVDNYKFLYYAMIRKEFKEKILSGCPQTTLPIINKTNWSLLTLRLPTPDEQLRIVNKLECIHKKTEQLQSFYNKKIKLLDDLKQSILKQAFAGEL